MSTLLGAITVVILTFYLLVESDALFAAFARLFTRENRPRVLEASRQISTKVSAWLSGQLILAGTIGSSAAVSPPSCRWSPPSCSTTAISGSRRAT